MPLTIDKETMEKHPLYQDGMAKGIEKGIEKGRLKGIREGELKAKREDIIKLHKKTKWDADKIADVLEIPVSFVKEILGEEK